MNDLSLFVQQLQEKFPGLKYDIDLAETEPGSSFLDIFSEGVYLAIEYRPGYGFGIHKDEHSGYGEGPGEVYRNQEMALKRVESILKDRQSFEMAEMFNNKELMKQLEKGSSDAQNRRGRFV